MKPSTIIVQAGKKVSLAKVYAEDGALLTAGALLIEAGEMLIRAGKAREEAIQKLIAGMTPEPPTSKLQRVK